MIANFSFDTYGIAREEDIEGMGNCIEEQEEEQLLR